MNISWKSPIFFYYFSYKISKSQVKGITQSEIQLKSLTWGGGGGAPRALNIAKFECGPSHVSDTAVTPASCSIWRLSLAKFALSSPVIPSIRKYPIGIFHASVRETAMTTRAFLARGELSSYTPAPMSAKPYYLSWEYLVNFRIDISSIITITRVDLLSSLFFFDLSDSAAKACWVKPKRKL